LSHLEVLFSVAGETALITGAGGGLGAAQARVLGLAGATIIASDVTMDAAVEASSSLNAKGIESIPFEMDVSSLDSIDRAFNAIETAGHAPSILLNNAGVSIRNSALEATSQEFDLTFGVNVRGLYFIAQRAARSMRRDGGGRIVNLASIGGLVVDGPRSSVYDASKAAVVQLTKNMAYEFAPHGIRVNAIAPGYFRTAMTAELMPSQEAEDEIVRRHIPMGRVGTPSDLEGAVLFLASGASDYVTGHTLLVDGGWLVSL